MGTCRAVCFFFIFVPSADIGSSEGSPIGVGTGDGVGLVLVSGGLGWLPPRETGSQTAVPALGPVAKVLRVKIPYLGSLTGGQVEGSLIA